MVRFRLAAVALFCLLPATQARSTGFLLAPASPAGNSPVAVALADLDGDGKLDAVVANSTAGTVSILAGKGNSTFGAPVTFTVGANPVALVVKDFNGDSKLDIAVVSTGSSSNPTVTVLLNTSSAKGTFSFSSASYPLATNAIPTAIAAGDLDGVNGQDLVIANGTAGGVSILLNNGNGSFGAATMVAGGSNTVAVSVADFNIDSHADIAVADAQNGNVDIIPSLGGTPPTFGPAVPISLPAGKVSTVPSAVISSDFDFNGKPDLAVADSANNRVIVLLNNSTGAVPSFATGAVYDVELMPVALATGDVCSRGSIDIISANKTSRSVSVLLNSNSGTNPGTFAVKSNWAMGPDPVGVAVGDIGFIDGTNDGKLDIVTANMSGNSVSGLLGVSTGTACNAIFYGPRNYKVGQNPVSIFAGGIATPGEFDIAAADHDSNDIFLLFNTNTGAFNNYFTPANPPTQPTDIGPRGILIGSFHPGGGADVATANDGLGAIVSATESGNTVTITTSAPDGYVVSQPVVVSGVGVAGYNGNFVITAVPSATTFQYTDTVAGLGASSGGTASTSTGNDITINSFKNGGTFSFSGTFALPAGTVGPRGVAGGFFSGNGKQDMAVPDFTGDSSGNNVTVFQQGNSNNNMVILQPPTNYLAHTNAIAATTGDFNGDSNIDIAIANNGSNDVSILLGNGNGTFGAPQNFAVGNKPVAIAVGDFNGDGLPDLAIANNADGTVTVLLNTTTTNSSTVTFAAGATYPVSVDPLETRAVDVNHDGILDLIVGSDNPNGLNVLLGNGSKGKGDGTFQAAQMFVIGNAPTSVASGDFNADSAPDVVFSNGRGNDITVVLNEGGNAPGLNVNPTSGVGPFTLTATLIPTVPQINVPSGTVTFTDNVLRLGTTTNLSPTANVAAGTALTTGITPGVATQSYTLTGGTQVISGTYSGDKIFNANTLPNVTINVGLPVTCVLNSSIEPVFIDQSVTYTLTINSTSGTPSGSVTFTDNGPTVNTTSTATLANGVATLPVTYTTGADVGMHIVRATYLGDSTHQGCTAGPFTEHVIKALTATTISSSLNPSFAGQAVTFTSVVTSNFGTPVGTVTFLADGIALGPAVTLNASSQAQITTTTLTGGSHVMTAQYAPTDTIHAPSSSPTLIQVVNKNPSSTALVANPASPGNLLDTSNTPITFTATVTGNTFGGAPGGSVQFFDLNNTLGAAVTLTPATATTSTAVFNTASNTLGTGAHLITAVYSGSGAYLGSTSMTLPYIITTSGQTVVTQLILAANFKNPVSFEIYHGQLIMTATIEDQSGATISVTAPDVSFFDGDVLLGTATPVAGVAQLTITARSTPHLGYGNHNLFAIWGGNTTDEPAASSSTLVLITPRAHGNH